MAAAEESSLVRSYPNLRNRESEKTHLNGGVLRDEAAIDSFVLSLESRGRSKATLSTYLEALSALQGFLRSRGMPPLLAVTGEHVRAFLKELYDRGNRPATVRNRWASLSAFYGWAAEEGELPGPGNPMQRVRPPQIPERILPHYTEEDIQRLMAHLPEKTGDEMALRDRAIILTLFDTGLRAAELCDLRLDVLSLRERTILVHGKGGKERAVGIGATTAAAIDRYLRKRRRVNPWLFASKDGTPLKTSGLRAVLQRRFEAAGVEFRGAHAFRRGFGITFLQAGGDPNDLKTLAGWSSYEMLRRYTRATETQRGLEAHRRFSPADRLTKR